MTVPADLPLWPDSVDAFYADRACSLRSDAARKTWGYTYRKLQRLHPGKPIGGFTTDDLVAFVTQRGWDTPRWSTATARNYRVAMEALFGWAHHAERIPVDPAWRLGQLVRIRRTRTWQPHWLTESQIAALLRRADGDDLAAQRDRTLLMLGLFAGLRTGELHRALGGHNTVVQVGSEAEGDCGVGERDRFGAVMASACSPTQHQSCGQLSMAASIARPSAAPLTTSRGRCAPT